MGGGIKIQTNMMTQNFLYGIDGYGDNSNNSNDNNNNCDDKTQQRIILFLCSFFWFCLCHSTYLKS
jgi:hypothetical protein